MSSPEINAPHRDRLTLMVLLAVAVHTMIILGIGFTNPPLSPPPEELQRTMEIILAPQQSLTPPDEADFLAQVHQRGSGDAAEEDVLASAPELEPLPLLTEESDENLLPEIAAPAPTPPEQRELTSQRPGSRPPPEERQPEPEQPLPENLTATQLIETSLQSIMRMSSEIERRQQSYREQPRREFISASTEAYRYAAYMEAWREKVERVGNLNYPDEARRQGLSGSLILEVVLRPDGHIESIEVIRSSGHRILDDAAVRIVHLSAPFGPFPESFRDEVDLLHITRTWQFLASDRLRTSR